MKSFSVILAAVANAQYGSSSFNDANLAPGGTTGHYGNSYGHGGFEDHSHQDHIYGYDSIAADWDIDAAGNATLRDAIIAAIEEAEADRLAYIDAVAERRTVRLEQIKNMNQLKIEAPFNYQIELINEEQDDIRTASNEALKDVNDSYDDMLFRLERLAADIIKNQENEVTIIKQTLRRAIVDHKNVESVFYALRIDWLDQIVIDPTADPITVTYAAGTQDFDMYDGIFDSFHYDIGHGKATHEGSLDSSSVRDGYSGAPRQQGPIGDWERDTGAAVSAWERPGQGQSRGMRY